MICVQFVKILARENSQKQNNKLGQCLYTDMNLGLKPIPTPARNKFIILLMPPGLGFGVVVTSCPCRYLILVISY